MFRHRRGFHWNFFPFRFAHPMAGHFGPYFHRWRGRYSRSDELLWLKDYREYLNELLEELKAELEEVEAHISELESKKA